MNSAVAKSFLNKRINAFLIVIGLVAFDISASVAQVCGYYYRKTITINGSRVTGGPHTNFPVLISHTDPALTTASAKVTNANGYDIIFTDNSGNALDFQLEKYNGTSGQIVAWVKIPSITNGTNVTIQMHYGNAVITTDQSSTSTWSSGYNGVWHFNNSVNDLSGSGITSVDNGTTNQAAGKIGDARNFVNPNNWVELTNFGDLTTGFTISGWIYPNDVSRDGQRIFVDDVSNTGGYGFSLADQGVPGRLRFYSRGSNPVSLDATSFTLSNNTWYHVAAVADITGSVKRIYVNGVERANATYTNAWGTDAGNASIGGETAGGETANRFHGNLDEIRVASRALSANWLATEYNSQNQPTTDVGVVTAGDFYTVGSEVFYGNPAQFGSDVWNVYAYNGDNFNSYYGYYVHNTLNFDSRTVWGAGASPSSASGYAGCTVPNDNHSYRYKRRGFTCGYYQLDIPNHDDNIVLNINGTQVFQQASWYDGIPKTNVWTGYLGPNSEVEYTIREFTGDSHAGLTFVYLYGPQNSATQTVWHGTTSTDWFTSSNWCGSVPSSTVGAYIPSNASLYPVISANGAAVDDLTIFSSASLTIDATRSLASHGTWTNNGTFSPNSSSSVVFSGSDANQLSGSSTTTFANVQMNNSNATALTLSTSMYVNGVFTFTQGDIVTGANEVVFNAGSSATAVSNASYVSGKVRKIGNTAFTFPIGKSGYYAPAGISAPDNVAYYFTAEYFNADPDAGGYNTASLTGLHHVSQCEYWTITRSAGASNETVTLSWDTPRSCGVTNIGQIRVAGWSGTQWASMGNGSHAGSTTTAGTETSGSVSTFIAFTLASNNASNPLPIELLSFTGTYKSDHILLAWKTAIESNNDFFTVDKSPDGKTWNEIGRISGGGTTHVPTSYSLEDDQPWKGVQYYRLSQTDFDGSVASFPLIAVTVERLLERTTIALYPNPTDDELTIRLNTPLKGPFEVQLINLYGNVVYRKTFEEFSSVLSLKDLSAGVYVIIVATNREIYRSKVVRK